MTLPFARTREEREQRGDPRPSIAVDDDGNEVAGVRPVELRVPIGTFTGWNPRHPAQGAPGDLMSMMGMTLPFARTREEREQRGDPRPSIAERYPSRPAYLDAVRRAAGALVAERWMLAEDVDAVVARAGEQWDLFHRGHLSREATAPSRGDGVVRGRSR
jgi:hypothetical protein